MTPGDPADEAVARDPIRVARGIVDEFRQGISEWDWEERGALRVRIENALRAAHRAGLQAGRKEEREAFKPLMECAAEFVAFASMGHGARPLTTNEVHIVVQQMDEALAALSAHRADPKEG